MMIFPTTTVGEIAQVKGGKRLPKGEQLVAIKTDHPYIRAQDIRNGTISISEALYVTDDIFRKINRYTVETNDVCIVIVGVNVGDVGIVPPFLSGANLTENAVKLTDLKDFDPSYLRYCLLMTNSQEQMKLFAAGAAQAKLGLYKIKQIQIPCAPLYTQRRIAAVLSVYDDLIFNNARRIQILEEMAQATYREWFVKFRFPGFEDVGMVDSELGFIPKGWEVARLGHVIELAYGKGLKADERRGGFIPVYGSSGIIGFHDEGLVEGPGIIVGRKGNVGRVFWSDVDFYPIDTTYYVRTEVPLHYVYYNLRNQNFINNDAAVPGLNRSQAYSLPFIVPDPRILNEFEAILDLKFKLIRNLKKKNEILRQSRDLLLPRLVSGQVDVSELKINSQDLETEP